MKKNRRRVLGRILAGTLAAVLLLGMAGCRDKSEEKKDVAMGRYLEEELSLPEGAMGIIDAKKLSDGRLALLGYGEGYLTRYWISPDDGETWEEQGDMPGELGLGEDGNTAMSLGSIREDGAVFCIVSTYDQSSEDEMDVSVNYSYRVRDLDGTYQECGLQFPESMLQPIKIQWLSDTEIIVQDTVQALYQMNVEDGSMIRQFLGEGEKMNTFGVVGNHLIIVGPEETQYYDLTDGKPEEEDTALSEQIKDGGGNTSLTSYNTDPLLFCQEEKENKLFYCDPSGVYSHEIGGNAMEQIIDGKLGSMGDPSVGLQTLFLGEDNTVYLAIQSGESGKLLKYVYSKDTPSVPSKEVTVYTLQENEELQQVISLFQKENPDYYVSLDVGMPQDSSVTMTDALKTLNTEIMAGKGPDLLLLDGMPISSYEEKGILADISQVIQKVDEKEGILDNIQEAYTKEGAIYEFPGRFGIPLVLGPKDKVSDMQTLDGLASVSQEQREGSKRFLSDASVQGTSENLLDGTYAAWVQKDGTLDAEKLKTYFQDVKEIYEADSHDPELTQNYTEESYSHWEMTLVESSALQVYGQECEAAVGSLYSPEGFSQLASSIESSQGGELDYALWNGQKEGCFVPTMLMGLNSKGKNQEDAKVFLEFLYSAEGQQLSMGQGFAVNESVFDSAEYWEKGGSTSIGYTVTDGDDVVRQVVLDVEIASKDQVARIQKMAKSLTVPAQLDQTVVDAVEEQLESYVSGESSLEDAVDAVIQKINLYLAE